jgi:hypothetical protein
MKKIRFTPSNLKRVLWFSIIMLPMVSCNGLTPTGNDGTVSLMSGDFNGTTSSISREDIRLYVDFETYEASEHLALDLETGLLTESKDADIEFAVSRGGGGIYFYFLQPINGARANFVSKTQPEKDSCLETEPLLTIGNIPEIERGNYICLITTQNNLAQIKIEDVNLTAQGQKWIELSFSTWK